jgi:hypothetical protein
MEVRSESRGFVPHRLVLAGVVCLAYAVAVLNLLPALALDIEALIINRYPDHVHRDTAVFWARLVLLYGSLPLCLPVLARAALWAMPQFGTWPGLLTRTPWPLRLLWAVILICLHAIFCTPLAVALSVWLSVESYWWIQWHQNIAPILEDVLSYSVWVALPALWALVLPLLFLQLSRMRPMKRAVLRWAARGLATLWLLAILASLSPALVGGGVHAAGLTGTPGRGILEQTCNGCHRRTRPLYFIKTPAEWRRTVTRMKEFEKAPIDDDEKEDVLAFLGGMRSYSDSWTFRTRCQRCHVSDYRGWTERDPGDWAALVDRMGRWSPYYYKKDVRDQIAAHLTATRSEEGATLGLERGQYDRYWKVARRCDSCHALSRASEQYSDRDEEAFIRLVSDMRLKMHEPFPASEIPSVARTYRELIQQPKLRKMLFPHDMLITRGELPW